MTHKASSINPNHIFVDTNVLVGGYSGDTRFQKDAPEHPHILPHVAALPDAWQRGFER